MAHNRLTHKPRRSAYLASVAQLQPRVGVPCDEIVDVKPRIHAVMAVEGDRGIAGHLHQAQIGTWFARAYVSPLRTGAG